MKKMTLAFGVLVLSFQAAAVEKYSSTVQDGTAHVISPGRVTSDEPAEEFLEQAAPAPKKAKLAAPQKLKAKTTIEARLDEREALQVERGAADDQETDSSEVPAPASDSAPVAAPGADEEVPALFPEDGVEMTSDEATAPAKPFANKRIPETVPSAIAPVEKRVAEKAAVTKKERNKYDVVPDEKVSEIAQRLKYANEILKRWGLAYDYRTVTLKEFKKVLAELEATEEKTEATN